MHEGDYLVAMDGVPVDQLEVGQVSKMAMGPNGSTVTLEFLRADHSETYTVVVKRHFPIEKATAMNASSAAALNASAMSAAGEGGGEANVNNISKISVNQTATSMDYGVMLDSSVSPSLSPQSPFCIRQCDEAAACLHASKVYVLCLCAMRPCTRLLDTWTA